MDRTAVTQCRIRELLCAHFPLAAEQQIADDASLLESGIVDSMGILEIVTLLEGEFHVAIVDEDLTPENFASIHSLTGLVESKQPAEQPSGGAGG